VSSQILYFTQHDSSDLQPASILVVARSYIDYCYFALRMLLSAMHHIIQQRDGVDIILANNKNNWLLTDFPATANDDDNRSTSLLLG
jgi:hypothetical protein